IHTVYLPYSFVPLLRFEGDKPPTATPLADKLEQEVGITLPPDFKQTLHHIEQALRANRLSTEQHAWLNQVQLSPEYLTSLLDPLPDTPYAAQLYDCNHLGTPQQLINLNGKIDWSITLDAWGNTLSEENPHQLHQPIRMQGQQYDEESGLHYNRHRYYDPTIGRYITQDPIGLSGGWNFYQYTSNPVQQIDPLGNTAFELVLAGMEIDASIPEPTDVVPWKWLGWGVALIGAGVYSLTCEGDKSDESQECSPPSGSVCYFYDQVPPAKPHHPHIGSHYHLFQMSKAPYCRWNKAGSSDIPPAGSTACTFPRLGGR
ncbi:RHS repeat-associated core domain-containing protein, partial [Obesumbacterium proteus]|uniref:RHS repeat-associated core domain-containing protein n=2 Tax=Obesumbacterium proteus TaxID=82983 RepID=UPI001F440913